ncbi:hypothetical protein QYE76_068527 [Lolium multiflorum]|uniref:Reverse transcriptase domain-containing protein n=1 Tax=Lolium multiflorum TaxID=4521 RepID=A0AAD8SEM0_LOLMU|nr:hypothetical protein QYE76_068527 [Lolium multiflorum]
MVGSGLAREFRARPGQADRAGLPMARLSRQFLKGWGANLGKEKRDRKAGLLAQVEALDALADSSGLDEEGWAFRYHLEDQGELSDQTAIMGHVYDFYRQLMGLAGEARAFTLAQDLWPSSKRISDAENFELERSFTLEELDAVLHDMKVDSAPGPDGLPVAFFLRLGGLFLKLDFEKVYDRVDWDFLREVLRRKGFSATMVHRLMQLVSGGQTAVNVNGEIGPFFRNARGVRQGDPLSPILFDFMVDALAAMLSRAKEAGHILGLVRHLIPGGVTHLQYADDTMVMIEPTDEGIANLKLVLISFELMSSLKINLAKSEVVVVGTTPLEQERVARLLNYRLGKFPIKYLGLPLSNKTLRASDWEFLTSKVAKRVDPWQGIFFGFSWASGADEFLLVEPSAGCDELVHAL